MKNWLLLDNQSMMDIFGNSNVLHDICVCNDELQLETNKEVLKTRRKRTLNNYGDVWYSPNTMTNILSLGNVTKNTE